MKNFMTIEEEVKEQIFNRADDSKKVVILGKNLVGIDFSYCDLTNVEFGNCNLKDADFSNAGLSTVNFESCNMANADFSSANLGGCHIIETSLKGADFNNATIEMSVITKSDFTNTNLNRCSIVFNTISDCDFCNSSIKSIANFTEGENTIYNCWDNYHVEKMNEAIKAKDFTAGYRCAKDMCVPDRPFEFMKNVLEIHGGNNQILWDATQVVQDCECEAIQRRLFDEIVEYKENWQDGRDSAEREIFANLMKSALMQGHGKIGSEKAINQGIKIAKTILPHWDDKKIKENLNHVLNKMQITLNEKREGNNLQR